MKFNRLQKAFIAGSLFATLCAVGTLAAVFAQQPAPAPAPAVKHLRGLNKLTPAQKQARAQGPWFKATTYPPQWSIISPKNSMFLNNTFGNCVEAGECVNINAHSFLTTGQPVIISDQEVQSWGQAHGVLNGADLLTVIGMMSVSNSDGLTYSGGTSTTMYCDGQGAAVNYQSRDAVCSACYSCSGSLKMGVAGDDLDRVGAGNSNGWYLGSATSTNIDHNVEMLGYGPASYCFQVLGASVPQGVDPNQFCYLVNTWSTIGVVNAAVVESSGWCDEIDIRNPTSIALAWGGPSPSPSPTPTPSPSPGPTPTRRMASLLSDLPALVDKYQSGGAADKAQVLSLLDDLEKRENAAKRSLGIAK